MLPCLNGAGVKSKVRTLVETLLRMRPNKALQQTRLTPLSLQQVQRLNAEVECPLSKADIPKPRPDLLSLTADLAR